MLCVGTHENKDRAVTQQDYREGGMISPPNMQLHRPPKPAEVKAMQAPAGRYKASFLQAYFPARMCNRMHPLPF
jgi:hypothetical protein